MFSCKVEKEQSNALMEALAEPSSRLKVFSTFLERRNLVVILNISNINHDHKLL